MRWGPAALQPPAGASPAAFLAANVGREYTYGNLNDVRPKAAGSEIGVGAWRCGRTARAGRNL